MSFLKKILFVSFFLTVFTSLSAFAQLRYHCPADSARVMKLLEAASAGESFDQRIALAAKALQGTPFAPAADNDSIGTIVVRLDSLNQREFIYVTLAAAKTASLTSPTIRDFEKNLENISRKKGKDEGFPSQFMYGADWIEDNIYRGNIKEMTEYLEGGNYRTKTLDYVSRHPELFPAMSDPDVAEKIRFNEFSFRSHRIPHLKKHSIGNKNIRQLMQNGDIIILLHPDADFDIYDIGIVSLENAEPTLIHFSKENNAIALDPYPLTRLFKVEGQFFYGFRWLHPVE